ncbi:MAG: VWA domain-containing protein [Deltaproteobacteria bacterium]|nr:VWA domain-containing protein [Nannocystaceae bacterium]
MNRAPSISLALLGLLVPALAHADSVGGTRSELLVERAHEIEVTIGYGSAELVVRRTVWNGGDRHDQAMFWIDVPEGGVAVGLRTLGELHGRPRWFAGELLEAELAASRYRELTGIGGYYPKDPALLSWRSASQLALQVFPCAPQAAKTVEYTLVLPTVFEEGRHHVVLPPLGTGDLFARARLHGASARDQLFVDGLTVAEDAVVRLDAEHEVSLARTSAPQLDGGLAMIPLGDDRVLFHYDVEAARELSSIPAHAELIVLVDRSRSIGGESIAAELTAARAYLSHFEPARLHARAGVIAFDRVPEDLLGGFVPVAEATALLETTTLAARNGSHVDLALQQAERLFEGADPHHPRRVVLFTDGAIRSALTLARVEALAERSGAVVHVVDAMPGSEAALERADDDLWSPVARATGGVAWDATLETSPLDLGARTRMFEELARPVRLHGLTIRAPGIGEVDLTVPETLDEGAASSALLLADHRVPHVIVRGELWATPVRKVLLPSAAENRLWAALVFGTGLLEQLDEPAMMQLALLGRAVSPVTSYLAIEPGVRPSTEGLEEGEGFGAGGLGLSGIGRGGGGAGHAIGSTVDLPQLMRDHLGAAVQACGGTSPAKAELETTFAEIVDVVTVSAGGDAVLDACVREQLWRTELEDDFRAPLQRWSISF